MKTFSQLFLLILATWSCAPQADTASQTKAPEFPERAKDMVIYEVNIRQYTPEGTFSAFAAHLPRLKDMGIDILWLMPIQPIGVEKRKGGLGSYYSIQDYRGVNPEFGSDADFKQLVKSAHDLGMLLTIDWVPNHTAWDHPWITSNPDYYAKDESGDIVMAHDWADVAQLDFENYEMRNEMIQAMKYWVEEFNIDGFRQDHAGHEIPIDFWESATEELNQIKDLFWLAEWNSPEMHFAFDATYAWAFHHLSGEVARGEKSADEIETFLKADRHQYGKNAYRMNFTSNHDENSWQGTVFERYGDGYKAMAVLMATIDGIPLLYSGQEAELDRRLKFFEKDTIGWITIPLHDFYKTLFMLRKENQALWSGDFGGRSIRINESNEDNVYAFKRSKEGSSVVVILNLTGEEQGVKIQKGSIQEGAVDVFRERATDIKTGESLILQPWEYQVYSYKSEKL